MTAKEFLQQVFKNYRSLDNKLEQIIRLQEVTKKVTVVINGVPTFGNSDSSRIENAIVSFHLLSVKLADDVTHFLDIWVQVAELISHIPNQDERLILEYRYLNFYSWQKISQCTNMTRRRVYQVHNDALKSVEKFAPLHSISPNFTIDKGDII